MQFPTPGPKAFAVACALLLAAILGVLVSMSPHQEIPRKLRVLALSPSGRWVAGGTPRGSVRVWDLQEGTSPARTIESTGPHNDLRFSRDGEYLAIANRQITLVPLSSQGEPRAVRADQANYGSVRFSADGRSLLTVNGNGSVLLIQLSTGVVSPVYCCTSIWGDVEFSPDETRVLWAGHWPGVWDLRAKALSGRLTDTREFMAFGPIAIDAAHELIHMGSQDGRVYEWNMATRKLLATSPPQSGYVFTIAVLGTSGWVAFAAEGGPVHLWHPGTGVNRIVSAARTTSNIVFDGSRGRTALGTESGRVEFWDLVGGRLLSVLPAAL